MKLLLQRLLPITLIVSAASLWVGTTRATAQLTITPTNTLSIPFTDSAQHAGELNRAKNLARQAAEKANGGLGRYRAEEAMHGPAAETHFIDNGDGTVTFTFVGGPPAYTTPTIETVATVNLSSGDVKLDYNGPIRQQR